MLAALKFCFANIRHMSIICASLIHRKIGEVQASLSEALQKVSKTNELLERSKEEGEREVEVLISKHEEDLKSFQERLNETVSPLEYSS